VRDASVRGILTPGRFLTHRMSGTATTYDDESTGDEFDQGKTIFNREFPAFYGRSARRCRPLGDAAGLRPMACAGRGLDGPSRLRLTEPSRINLSLFTN